MAASVLLVDPSHINSAEVAVSDMVCWLPPNHGISKLQTTLLAFGPLILGDGGSCTKSTKMSMVSMLCEKIPVRNNGVFTADVAEYVRLISASHFIQKNKKTISHKLADAKSSEFVYCNKYKRTLHHMT